MSSGAATRTQRGSRAHTVEHHGAFELARSQIRISQTPDYDPGVITDLQARAMDHGWVDVLLVTDYVRLLASENDPDEAPARHAALLERARASGDIVFEALALGQGATAVMWGDRARLDVDRDLARATVLLRDAPQGHKMLGSAHVECATAYLDRDMWDLALEHTSEAAAQWETDEHDLERMGTLLYNRAEIHLRRLCVLRQSGPAAELVEFGDRARFAAQHVPIEQIPESWRIDVHIFENLVDAIAPPETGLSREMADGEGTDFATYVALARSFVEPDAGEARRFLAEALDAWDRVRYPELYLLALTRDAELESVQLGFETAGLRVARELALRRHEARVAGVEAMASLIREEQMLSEHARLRVEAELDALTGVANRRGLAGHVDALTDRVRGLGRDPEMALVLVDVDHFKGVNDTFGHDVGDEVLVRVANALRTVVRETDLVVRWGGDEFILLLDTDDLPAATRRCRSLARGIRGDHWDDLAPGLSVTVSIGLAVGKISALDDLRDAADRALYRVKAAGRDGVAT
ncbi:GGDEF domain-containing protein [Oryzobacter telluris]|uniref:GGDEF domain-containing protein n=1 Tax=Oryzobacter telluris TaxID=3149179 RepID=UPI00370D53A1